MTMNFLQKLGIGLIAVLNGVLTAEHVASAEVPNTPKLQIATDIAAAEIARMGVLLPSKYQPILSGGANLAVAALNLFGVFSHKQKMSIGNGGLTATQAAGTGPRL
jgi:hypothetical protein